MIENDRKPRMSQHVGGQQAESCFETVTVMYWTSDSFKYFTLNVLGIQHK